jgi:hypothetical protein
MQLELSWLDSFKKHHAKKQLIVKRNCVLSRISAGHGSIIRLTYYFYKENFRALRHVHFSTNKGGVKELETSTKIITFTAGKIR